jgi:hypothetical protein
MANKKIACNTKYDNKIKTNRIYEIPKHHRNEWNRKARKLNNKKE